MNRSYNGGYRVYVGGITSRIERQDLHREFGQYGPVVDVYMGRKDPEIEHNFAFVVFKYPEDADEAVLDRHGRKICGVYVKVEHAKPFREDSRRGGFQRGGFDGPRGFRGRGGYGSRGSYGGGGGGGYRGYNGYNGYRDNDRWNGQRDRGDYQPRRREKFRQSPSPGYDQGGYTQGGGRWQSRSRSPVMERRRNNSNVETNIVRTSRYSPDILSDSERRHKKKLTKSKRQLSPSPSPPPKKKSRKRKQSSSSEDESQSSSSSESRSPTPPPKKKKKKKKKVKSVSPSASPEYETKIIRVPEQRESRENYASRKRKPKQEEFEEREEGFVSSSSG